MLVIFTVKKIKLVSWKKNQNIIYEILLISSNIAPVHKCFSTDGLREDVVDYSPRLPDS